MTGSKHSPAFVVSRDGLRKLLARRGRQFVVWELLSNAWDEAAAHVQLTIEPVPGQPKIRVVVEDDAPHGFRDLADAYTLYAESYKKGAGTVQPRREAGHRCLRGGDDRYHDRDRHLRSVRAAPSPSP